MNLRSTACCAIYISHFVSRLPFYKHLAHKLEWWDDSDPDMLECCFTWCAKLICHHYLNYKITIIIINLAVVVCLHVWEWRHTSLYIFVYVTQAHVYIFPSACGRWQWRWQLRKLDRSLLNNWAVAYCDGWITTAVNPFTAKDHWLMASTQNNEVCFGVRVRAPLSCYKETFNPVCIHMCVCKAFWQQCFHLHAAHRGLL